MFEVDTDSDDPIEARKEALEQIGEAIMIEPDCRWVAISHQTNFIGSQINERIKEGEKDAKK